VLITRTFSKIFGMAGMRVGFCMGHPDLLKKLLMHDDGALSHDLPIPSIAAAAASLTAHDLMDQCRKQLVDVRGMTEDFLKKRNLRLILPTEANMLMVDWKTKTGHEMQTAFVAQGVELARTFPAWPTVTRITIGSKADMEASLPPSTRWCPPDRRNDSEMTKALVRRGLFPGPDARPDLQKGSAFSI
jgi:histidinol-phosphate aminotransferase